jgi:hypothetical protein
VVVYRGHLVYGSPVLGIVAGLTLGQPPAELGAPPAHPYTRRTPLLYDYHATMVAGE